MNVILITADGNRKKINIETFSEARELVCNLKYNSPAEIIFLSDSSLILFDEEGKFKNLQTNKIATEIAHENNSIYPSDFIVGDVLLIDNVNQFDDLPFK